MALEQVCGGAPGDAYDSVSSARAGIARYIKMTPDEFTSLRCRRLNRQLER